MEITTKSQAIASGSKTYFTGKPCARGHISVRYTSIGKCRDCSFEDTGASRKKLASMPDAVAKREAIAERKKNDPDRSKYFAEYREKNKEICYLRSKASKGKKLDLYNAKRRERRTANADKENEKRREYRRRTVARNRFLEKARRDANPEKFTARTARYRATPKGKAALRKSAANRNARKKQAMPPWFGELDAFVWAEAAHLSALRELATGILWAADHMIPIACKKACGLHTWNNVQVIPASVNNAKKNKLILIEPGEWLQQL